MKKITMFVMAAGVLLTGCGAGESPTPTVTVTERVPAPAVTSAAPSPSKSRDSVADLLFPPSSSPTPTPTPSRSSYWDQSGFEVAGKQLEFCQSSRRGAMTPDECMRATKVLSDGTVAFK